MKKDKKKGNPLVLKNDRSRKSVSENMKGSSRIFIFDRSKKKKSEYTHLL